MAAPTITLQPSSAVDSRSVRSTLLPITFEVSSDDAGGTSQPDTLYIVATLAFYNADIGMFEELAGGMRLQQDIDDVKKFRLNAEQAYNTLTHWDYNDLKEWPGYWEYRIGMCGENFKCGQISLNGKNMYKVRVKFQREFLNATTNLIELESANVMSNDFYVIESGFKQQDLFSMRESSEFDAFTIIKTPGTYENFRILTNMPQPMLSTRDASSNFASFIASRYTSAGVLDTAPFYALFQTFDGGGVMVGIHVLDLTATQNPGAWGGQDVGQFMFPCGIRDLECAIENGDPGIWSGLDQFFPGESTDGLGTSLDNVANMMVSIVKTVGWGAFDVASQFFVANIQDPSFATNTSIGCASFSSSASYVALNFHFKNILGGLDRYICYGNYSVKKIVSANKFQKTNSFDKFDKDSGMYGIQTVGNESVDEYSINAYRMTPAEAEWVTEMFMSPMVLFELPTSRNVGDSYLWSNSMVVPVQIKEESITYKDTLDGFVEMEFSFVVAKKTKNPTN